MTAPAPAAAAAALTTGALARRLGVSPTTIRSWESRYGIGPAHRDPGRHRRWEPHDVAVLEEMCRLTARGVTPAEAARVALAVAARPAAPGTPPLPSPAVPAPGGNILPVGTVRPECRGLARAAVRLDAPEMARILRRSIDDLGAVTAWTEVMTPALRAAGRKWAAEGERCVEVEHLLSWHVAAALRRAADRADDRAGRPPGPAALLAGTPTELHSLPLEAVAAGLAERGLAFRMFGPALPPEALLEAVRRTGPPAVLLWSQAARTADRALAHRVARTTWGPHGARTGPVVLTAGPGWAGPRRPPGTLRPRDLATALDQLERLLR
ncbi:MerR family transcriptional regulator [Kitasatospora sp. NPDC086791]|uniref:MerR family transcriptional regulator n=1 Tax=Kitasatospora sp. NPDC086791 TaxID=3155178 RepID=UPI0034384E66